MDEKKQIAVTFLYELYTQLNYLTSLYSDYVNILAELRNKYPNDKDLKDISDAETSILNQSVQYVRKFATSIYIKYKTISKSLFKRESKEIDKLYNSIKTEYIMKADTLEKYILELNDIIINSSIISLINDNVEIVNKIFTNQNADNTANNTNNE